MKKSAAARIDVQGELSIFAAAELRRRLLDALDTAAEVEVDLSQVSEMDSAGVQLMVAAKREAAARNKVLRFSGHSPTVFDILELCDLAGHLGDPVLIHSEK
ncbi:MAG: STAS domain-containing protein [Rhodocyclales bacterium]|nr:STAS domain-containing protein [Rhodocyclales bacterium]